MPMLLSAAGSECLDDFSDSTTQRILQAKIRISNGPWKIPPMEKSIWFADERLVVFERNLLTYFSERFLPAHVRVKTKKVSARYLEDADIGTRMSPVAAHFNFVKEFDARPLKSLLENLVAVAEDSKLFFEANHDTHFIGRTKSVTTVLTFLQDDDAFDNALFLPQDKATRHAALYMAHAYNGVANNSWHAHDEQKDTRYIARPLQFGFYLQDLSTHLHLREHAKITLWSLFTPSLRTEQRPTSRTTLDLLRRYCSPYEFALR